MFSVNTDTVACPAMIETIADKLAGPFALEQRGNDLECERFEGNVVTEERRDGDEQVGEERLYLFHVVAKELEIIL